MNKKILSTALLTIFILSLLTGCQQNEEINNKENNNFDNKENHDNEFLNWTKYIIIKDGNIEDNINKAIINNHTNTVIYYSEEGYKLMNNSQNDISKYKNLSKDYLDLKNFLKSYLNNNKIHYEFLIKSYQNFSNGDNDNFRLNLEKVQLYLDKVSENLNDIIEIINKIENNY